MRTFYLILSVLLIMCVSAQAGLVPNGSFEEIYKPGTVIPGVISENGWTQGVGPDCPIESGWYEFADATTGDFADIPGWVGYDPEGWRTYGGTYDRPYDREGSNQGSVSNQTSLTGNNCYLANGGAWGNPAGGLIVSDAPLELPDWPGGYVLSMFVKGGAGPMVLDLLLDGDVIAPDSSVTPELSDEWQLMSRTYNSIDPGDVTIVVGVGRPPPLPPDGGATGTQSQMDDVTLIPEPATMLLLGLGGLALLRRKRG